MSSTNKTTNYDLSQFIGDDKPAWLADYNADMSKIDAGINTAQSTATSANGKSDANTTAIGTLANLTTTAKTNLVAAINEVDTNVDATASIAETATQTANNASTSANSALSIANALSDYITMSTITAYTGTQMSTSGGTLNIGASKVTVAKNSTSSMGKVYGTVRLQCNGGSGYQITLNVDTGIHPEADIQIAPAGNAAAITPPNLTGSYPKQVTTTLKTNGNIIFSFYADQTGDYVISLYPCLYFFTDFGDTPIGQ